MPDTGSAPEFSGPGGDRGAGGIDWVAKGAGSFAQRQRAGACGAGGAEVAEGAGGWLVVYRAWEPVGEGACGIVQQPAAGRAFDS